jgi:hypothetical protein
VSADGDPSQLWSRRIAPRLLSAIVMVAGFAAALTGLGRFGASYATTRWPVAPGRITRSEVVEGPASRFRPIVEYGYVVGVHQQRGGGLYTPSVDAESGSSTEAPLASQVAAESVIARYPTGKEMLVGYDPVDIRRSVLEPRIRWVMLLPIVVGAGAMSASVLLLRGREAGER